VNEIVYKALLVGNSRFEEDPHILLTLKGPPNDIRALEDILVHPQIGLHSRDNIISLLECNNTEIMEKLEEFFCNAGRNDQLLFYYSGHGQLDKYDNLYLCARNTKTSNLISTAIPDVTINSMIQNSISKRIIIILDCCHSGKFKGGIVIPKNLTGEGRFVITSSRARELTEDAKTDEDFSPFTKHFVNALLSNEIDINQDNFISLNEVYDYILPRLQEETKQNPQRNFEGAVGELAISRSIRNREETTDGFPQKPDLPPRIAVSATNIEIKDINPNERIPEEVIDVYNEGGGVLEWKVECKDEWIVIERFKGYFTMKFNPLPGNNRGKIFVRENGGGCKLIQVFIQVKESLPNPIIEVSSDKLEFGKLILNSPPPPKTVRINNKGGGNLNPQVFSSNSRFTVRLINDLVEVSPDVSKVGYLTGELIINSDGGKVNIQLTASVESGPILNVSPKSINFGAINEKEIKTFEIDITNIGSSKLKWNCERQGSFFSIKRTDDKIIITIKASAGNHHGVIIIKSNGGDITVNIKGTVTSTNSLIDKLKGPKGQFPIIDISGTWNVNGMSTMVLTKLGNNYKFQEYNLMNVCCSEGTLTSNGDHFILNGYNILMGQMSGIFWPQHNFINATITSQGMTSNLVLNRINTNDVFNIINLFNI
jgi:hypothetical protein